MSSPATGSTPFSMEMPSLGDTFGVLLLSTFLSLMLYGLTLAQTIRYRRLYPSDRLLLKGLVFAIFLSDTFHSASMIDICYHYLVRNYSSPAALAIPIWTVNVLPLSTGINALLSQGFLTRRIYVVTGAISCRYRLVVWFITCLLFVEFGFMIATTVASLNDATFEDANHSVWMDTAIFGIATTVDLILTATFVAIMRQNRTSFLRTDSALDMLARYAVVATALLSALAIPAFVCSLALPHTFVYFAIAIPAVKVYSNSVLAVLNCRKSLPRPGIAADCSEWRYLELPIFGDRRGELSTGSGRTLKPASVEQDIGSSHVILVTNIVSQNIERPK